MDNDPSHVSLGLNARPVFQPGVGPDTMGSAYMPIQRDGSRQQTYQDIIADQKRVEDVSFVFACYFYNLVVKLYRHSV